MRNARYTRKKGRRVSCIRRERIPEKGSACTQAPPDGATCSNLLPTLNLPPTRRHRREWHHDDRALNLLFLYPLASCKSPPCLRSSDVAAPVGLPPSHALHSYRDYSGCELLPPSRCAPHTRPFGPIILEVGFVHQIQLDGRKVTVVGHKPCEPPILCASNTSISASKLQDTVFWNHAIIAYEPPTEGSHPSNLRRLATRHSVNEEEQQHAADRPGLPRPTAKTRSRVCWHWCAVAALTLLRRKVRL